MTPSADFRHRRAGHAVLVSGRVPHYIARLNRE